MQNATPNNNKLYICISILVMVVAVAIINTIAYCFNNERVEVNSLHAFNNMVLSRPPEKYQNDESRKYYYVFSFLETKRRFSLEEKYYNYSRSGLSLKSLKAGDTLSIQLTPEAMRCYNDLYEDHIVEFVNFSRRNAGFIDLSNRNRLINADNKKAMFIWWVAAGLIGILTIFLLISRNRKLNNTP